MARKKRDEEKSKRERWKRGRREKEDGEMGARRREEGKVW